MEFKDKIKVLNLYAGIGGNRKLWDNVEITAVEHNTQIAKVYMDFFPEDTVIIGDAHQYLLEHFKEFDFIWSSPPCPTHSRLNICNTRKKKQEYPDMKLYEEILFLQQYFKGKWCVENVIPFYKPLIYGQEVHRHLFWSNFVIPKIRIKKINVSKATKQELNSWLGMDYDFSIYTKRNHCDRTILRNCVHPKLGLHVFKCAFKEKQNKIGDFHRI